MIRAAIVGLGRWGRNLVRAGNSTGVIRFVCGHTRSRDKAEAFAHAHGFPLKNDLDAVFGDPRIDAVVLATPHTLHAEQVTRAAGAGKHVFVEKPFALTRRSAEAALEAVARAGVTLAVGFNRRFHPSMAELRARLAGGRLGAIVSFAAEHTAFQGFVTPPDNWRADPAESPAAAMTALGAHTVDTVIDLLGPIAAVHATSSRRAAPVDDTNCVLLHLKSGVAGTFQCSLATAAHYRFAVYGAQGLAEVVRPTLEEFRFVPLPHALTGEQIVEVEPEVIGTPNFDTLAAELSAFAAAIEKRTPYPVTPEQVLHGVAVLEAVVASAETGRTVEVGR
jgi:predicted dehydrogenase